MRRPKCNVSLDCPPFIEVVLTDKSSFQPVGPEMLQEGDIVEVQVSFIAIPLRDGKWKINTTMRSMTLFDGTFTQVGGDGDFQKPRADIPSAMVPSGCVC